MFKWINNSRNKPSSEVQDPPHPFNQHPPTNPEQLPSLILELQFQCEGENSCQELITRLTSLYLEAIQYHRDLNTGKDKLYKTRMALFLKKSKIGQILQGKCGEQAIKKDIRQRKFFQARFKSKSQMDRIITKTQKIANKHQNLLNQNLKMQEDKLQGRINKRKTMSNRSSFSRDQQNQEGEQSPRKSIGLQRSARFVDLVGLEDIGAEKKVFI